MPLRPRGLRGFTRIPPPPDLSFRSSLGAKEDGGGILRSRVMNAQQISPAERQIAHCEQSLRDSGILVRIARELEMGKVLYEEQTITLDGRMRESFIRRRLLDALYTNPPGLEMPPVEAAPQTAEESMSRQNNGVM